MSRELPVLLSRIDEATYAALYERLSHPDRREFFTVADPAERLRFLLGRGILEETHYERP